MWGAKVCLSFLAHGGSDMAAYGIGVGGSSKRAYFMLLYTCSMKKQLTKTLTAVLFMPIWGWGFFCKGWKLLPIPMMPSALRCCIWQPLLASYLLFQCLGDCVMFMGRNITADCIYCIFPPFPLPLITICEDDRNKFWVLCCKNCTASALWCQHVTYGLG